jgi:uncharacterized protein YbaR (Trm112 family)
MASRSDYENIKCPVCETNMILHTLEENDTIYADYLKCPKCKAKACIEQEEIECY